MEITGEANRSMRLSVSLVHDIVSSITQRVGCVHQPIKQQQIEYLPNYYLWNSMILLSLF